MEFFIALLGGLFYTIWYCRERSGSKQNERGFKEWWSYHKEFGRLITDSQMEDSIEKMIAAAKINEKLQSEIYDSIKDNLIVAVGEADARDFFLLGLSIQSKDSLHISLSNDIPEQYWIKHLLLSKKGKMGEYEFNNGYALGFPCYRDRNIRILKEIEKNLQAAKTGVRFRIKKGHESHKDKMVEIHLLHQDNTWDMYK